jgi:hypothetical protein
MAAMVCAMPHCRRPSPVRESKGTSEMRKKAKGTKAKEAKKTDAKIAEMVEAIRPLMLLLDDISWCHMQLRSGERVEFWKRTYARALFAYVEGEIWLMRSLALKAHEDGTLPLDLGDLVILRQETYTVDTAKGVVQTRERYPSLEASLKHVFRCFAAIRNPGFVLETSSGGWSAFKNAMVIRNRVTHPKQKGDLEISDDEMRTLERAIDWFSEMGQKMAFPHFKGTMRDVRQHLIDFLDQRRDLLAGIVGEHGGDADEILTGLRLLNKPFGASRKG